MARMPVAAVVLLNLTPPPVVGSPDPEDLLAFDNLLDALDTGTITREGWDKLRRTIATAITSSRGGDGDDIRGLQGYVRVLLKWQRSRHYDGQP